ncbi:MAG: hypothetical protein IH889_02730 [Planctomycetes bacterium]|nr:hypothetical protein [Planctomycetota bacterium]
MAIVATAFFAVWTNRLQQSASSALTEIKVQGDALQKLTARWMDRLTKYATREPRLDPSLQRIIEQLAPAPRESRLQSDLSAETPVNQDTIDCLIVLLFYIAIANVYAAMMVPVAKEFDMGNALDVLSIRHTDQCFNDFQIAKAALARVDQAMIQQSQYSQMYREATTTWEPLMKKSAQAMAEHSKAGESEEDDIIIGE